MSPHFEATKREFRRAAAFVACELAFGLGLFLLLRFAASRGSPAAGAERVVLACADGYRFSARRVAGTLSPDDLALIARLVSERSGVAVEPAAPARPHRQG